MQNDGSRDNGTREWSAPRLIDTRDESAQIEQSCLLHEY
jgi:hypothetical protein